MSDETLEAMCDNEVMQKLGWLSGVLADSGYGEQAGDVMRAMVFIHEQAQEIEKLRASLKPFADLLATAEKIRPSHDRHLLWVEAIDLRAAAAALKEVGDE